MLLSELVDPGVEHLHRLLRHLARAPREGNNQDHHPRHQDQNEHAAEGVFEEGDETRDQAAKQTPHRAD